MASGNPLHCVILNPELIDYFILHLKTIWLVQLLEIRKTKKPQQRMKNPLKTTQEMDAVVFLLLSSTPQTLIQENDKE